ncbi:MAG: hypothetical protein EA397_11485 [Deltaproteobacteria bacterium]|nr:MAG: hypothetical protein EA397_11485 [Deltaproteobacteria bacterium]
MPRVTMQVQALHPKEPWWPSDDALGNYLVELVAEAIDRGGAAPAMVGVWREELQILPIAPVLEQGWAPQVFLGSLSRTPHANFGTVPEAVGIVGRLRYRRTNQEPWVSMAIVFLEWPDGRWWRWRQLLDADGKRTAESATWDRAVDGLPRPDNLGGWWRLGRLGAPPLRVDAMPPQDPSEIVQ